MKRGFHLLLALALLHLLLVAPNHPRALTFDALTLLPLELPLLLLGVMAVSRWPWAVRGVALALGVVLAGLTFAKIADVSAQLALARRFNWLLDGHLIAASWEFLTGVIGPVGAGLTAVALVGLLTAIAGGVAWAVGEIAAAGRHLGPARALAVGGLVAAAFVSLAIQRHTTALSPPIEAFTSKLAVSHVRGVVSNWNDLARFRDAAAGDAFATLPSERLLKGLGRRDVVLTFVESYGRSAITHPRYRQRTRAALDRLDRAVAARGLAARSAWLTAPTVGGQSWLSHATFLSGLWVDNQSRYAALVNSDRRALTHLFGRAGWRRVAVMPAITRAWPDGRYYGYDRIYDEAALDYAGRPFNWVTMPDQYSLAALSRRELTEQRDKPVFAEVAMISSHAPWTPVPPVLAWDAIGDGSVFNRWADSGDPPAEVWRSPERVRAQYGKAIGYVLKTLGAFVDDKLPADAVLIVLGDHQPAPLVTGPDTTRQVPTHIIGPPEVLDKLDAWDWSAGLVPAANAPVWRMDAFRDHFLSAFTPGSAAGES